MCVGAVMPVMAVVATVASGGVSVYGQYQEGQSKNKYYQYLADQNERQASDIEKTAENQVTLIQDKAARDAKDLKNSTAKIAGTQKATMAAMGISGVTAEDIITDTFNKAKLDAANLRYNADIESWSTNKEASEQASALRSQSASFRFAGKEAKRAAGINMTSTLLGTAGSILGSDLFKTNGLGYKNTGQKISYGGKNYKVTTPTDYSKVLQWNPGKLS
jgi:hypothetical protein